MLDAPRDYIELIPRGPLDSAHRVGLADAVDSIAARGTGTALYDTLLAAYTAAQDGYREGVPNQVILFTDGRNEDRPGSISAEELTDALTAASDLERPVQLTIITFGTEPVAQLLVTALQPVQSYVTQLSSADEIRAVFIHLAAGGSHR